MMITRKYNAALEEGNCVLLLQIMHAPLHLLGLLSSYQQTAPACVHSQYRQFWAERR